MKSSIKVIPLVIAGLWAACNLSPVSAEEFNLEQMVQAGKRVKQVKSPKAYQLYHVTPQEIPNSDLEFTGPLYMKLADGKVRQIADHVEISRISPDGRTFFTNHEQKLYIVNDSGTPELIAENVSSNFAFDKTGKHILVSRPIDVDILKLDLISRDGKTVRNILPEGNYIAPRFTPDGKQILYASSDTGIVSWYIVNIDGTNKRQLTNVGMKSGRMTDEFVPIMSTSDDAGFIDDTHFKYREGTDIWVLDITTGKASKIK